MAQHMKMNAEEAVEKEEETYDNVGDENITGFVMI